MAKVGRKPKLTDQQVTAALFMLRRGVLGYQAALHFNVSPALISGIKTGKRYVHVTRPVGESIQWLD